jgi:hypothetical protein
MEKMKIDGISFGKRQFTPERLPHQKKLYSACEIVEKIDKSKDESGRKTGKDNQDSPDIGFPPCHQASQGLHSYSYGVIYGSK